MEVMLPEEEILNLEKGVRKSHECIINALVKIDAEKASSFYAADREHILAAVRKSKGGIDAVNKMVKDFLRSWYLTTLKEIVVKADKNDWLIYGNVASVFNAFSLVDDATEYNQKAFRLR